MALRDRTVVVTRPRHQVGEMTALLQARGALPVIYPTLEIVAASSSEQKKGQSALRGWEKGAYHGVLFTSVNAVRFTARLGDPNPSLPTGDQTPVFAIGDKTAAELRRLKLSPHISDQGHSEGFLEFLARERGPLAGLRFLFFRARDGRTVVIDGLRAKEARVDAITVYHTVPLRDLAPLPAPDRNHWITFTSPSAVHAFLAKQPVPPQTRVACLGPTTAAAARKAGITVSVVPKHQTLEAMLDAMERYQA